MARLIDAYELLLKTKRFATNTAGFVYDYEIRNAPTVEAIPIKWVKRWAMKSENTYNREQIVEMLNDWEKENG